MQDALSEFNEIGNYILTHRIGAGAFASVWEAEHKLAKIKVAIKAIRNSILDQDETRKFFVREVAIMKQIDHPFISKLFEIVRTDEFTFVVMEFAEKGSIMDFVTKTGPLSESIARRVFSQIISALEYLHEVKHVIHRDLKAENVLLDRNLNIRLIDFGLSNSFTNEEPELSTACGSPAYAPPEMITGQRYTKAADMWSAGVLLYMMTVGKVPFWSTELQEMLWLIAYAEPEFPAHLSPELVDLIKKLVLKDAGKRVTIERVKMHPWFSHNEYSELMSLRFATDNEWIATGVSREMVETIASCGMDIRTLPSSVLSGGYNEETAVYYMLRRADVTDRIKEVMRYLDQDKTRIRKPATVSREPVWMGRRQVSDSFLTNTSAVKRNTGETGQLTRTLDSTKRARKSVRMPRLPVGIRVAQCHALSPRRRSNGHNPVQENVP